MISVGLPVRNGGPYLEAAVASILGQTFGDLELIISDNASTDRTQEVCERFAARDPRVRYFRQTENIGGPGNWNFVFAKARGRYFKWASANDVCEPTFLERCERVLADDPDVVLSYPRTLLIDGEGAVTSTYAHDFALPEPDPVERFVRMLHALRLNNAHQGLIRSSSLRSTGLERDYESGDLPLMAELAILGKWHLVPDPLLRRRVTAGTHMADLSAAQRKERFYSASGPLRMPFLRMWVGYCTAVARSSLGVKGKLRALANLMRMLRWNRRRAVRDVRGLLGWRRG